MLKDNKFTIGTECEEYTVLELLNKYKLTFNEFYEILKTKTDLYGDHLGSWHGVPRPSLSTEGLGGMVEHHDTLIKELQEKLNMSLDELNVYLTSLNEKMNEVYNKTNWISPDTFTGTDVEKITQAINYAINNNYPHIRIDRDYNITGGTILIDKGENPRQPVFIEGNGTIYKYDEGYFFDSTQQNFGDLYLQGVRCEGNDLNLATVFNCNNIIRIHSTNCFYKYVKCVYFSDSSYIQSIRTLQDTYTYINDVFYFNYCYDVVCDNVIVERSKNFIRDIKNSNLSNGITIINSCIEGLSGYVLSVEGGACLTILNNYFEINEEYFNIDGTGFMSITFNNNFIYDNKAVDKNVFYLQVRTRYMNFNNNHVDVPNNFVFLNVKGNVPLGIVVPVNTYCKTTNFTNKDDVFVKGDVSASVNGNTTIKRNNGAISYTYKIPYFEMLTGERKVIEIPTEVTPKPEDMVTVLFQNSTAFADYTPTLKGIISNGNKFHIALENTTANTVGTTLLVTVLRINTLSGV